MAENKHEGLVNFVLQAHGGLDLWSGLIKITARLSIAGPICAIKGWPDALVKETVEIEDGHETDDRPVNGYGFMRERLKGGQ